MSDQMFAFRGPFTDKEGLLTRRAFGFQSELWRRTGEESGVIPVEHGGTGLTAGVSGGILGFTAATVIASSVLQTLGAPIVGGGVGATPYPLPISAVATRYLANTGALNAAAWDAVNLTNGASGTLQAAQFPALLGDVTTGVGSLTTAIGTNKVTLPMMAQIADARVLGNSSGITANVAALATLPTGVQDNITRLGTVVSGAVPTSLLTGLVTTTQGGTGANLSAGASGGVPFFNALGVMGASGVLPATQVLLGGGAGAAPNSSASVTFNGTQLKIARDVTYPSDITNVGSQFSVSGATASTKRLNIGYDTTSGNGFGFLAAGNFGVAWTNLVLQPTGGNIGVGVTVPLASLHIDKSASGALGPALFFRNSGGAALGNESQLAFGNDSGASIVGNASVRLRAITTNAVNGANSFQIQSWNGAAETVKIFIASGGNIGVAGIVAPTAILHFPAGTAAASSGPLKFTSGTLLTTAEAMAVEALTDNLHFTITTGAARKGIMLDDGARLTSARVPFATTNGRLTDDADLTFATDTLSATKVAVKAGAAAGTTVKVGGVIFEHVADGPPGGGGGAETDLYSNTLAADIFGANGDKVVASYGGNFVTLGTESVQLKAKFNGTTMWDSTAIAIAVGTSSWRVNVELIRVSSTVIRYTVSLNTTGASGFVYASVGELTGLTLTGTNPLALTGTSTGVGSGSGDIVGKMGIGMFHPAA